MSSKKTLFEYTQKIREIVQGSAGSSRTGRFFVAYDHIETERAWRKISRQDVVHALMHGQVNRVESEKVFWRGVDADGRMLELICHLQSPEFENVFSVQDASVVQVETAYQPDGKFADEVRRTEFLKANPTWEDDGQGGVRRVSKTN